MAENFREARSFGDMYNQMKLYGDITLVGEAYLHTMGIANVGRHISTVSPDGVIHLHTVSEFDGELTTGDACVLYGYNFTERKVLQADDSGLYTGTDWESQFYATTSVLSKKRYFKTGPTVPNHSVTMRIYKGTDDTGILILDQTYNTSYFPASSEIELPLDGYFETHAGENYFTTITCDSDFSIKTNSAGTAPWVAADDTDVRVDCLLQTKPWVSGELWDSDDLYIDDRQIYKCNSTGVQTGTFAGNSDKWNPLADKGYTDIFDNRTLQTGIISGGALSIATASTINIASGTGVVIDATDASNIIRSDVSWDEVLGYSPNLSLDGSNIILVDSNGNISDIRNVDKTDETFRDYIIIGTISIFMGGIIFTDSRPENLGYNGQSFQDFFRDVIGTSTISGLIYSSNSNDLALQYSSGVLYDIGTGFAIGEQNTPNERDISGATTPVLFMTYHNGPTLYPDGAPTIYVNPNKIDNGDGTLSAVGNNNWTVQRIFYSPTATLVSYGQEEYNTYDLALDAFNTQDFFEAGALPSSWFRSYLIIKEGATDLSDTTQAVFFAAPKFRLFGVGGAEGGVSAHSSLFKLEWDVAGHLFEDAGVFDLGNYSLLMTDRLVIGDLYSAMYSVNGIYYLMVANGQISLNDNHGPRFEADSTDTIIASPWDGSEIVLRDSGIAVWGSMTLHDAITGNIEVTGSIEALGAVTVGTDLTANRVLTDDILCDTTFNIKDGTQYRLEIGTILGRFNSPDDNTHVQVSNTGIDLINHSIVQVSANDYETILRSPDGTKAIEVDDTRIDVTGDLYADGYIASGGRLQCTGTGDGTTLLQFETDRRWVFQQEGSGSGASLRLRNLLGQNKTFSLDTNGTMKWRTYDGVSNYMMHTAGVLWMSSFCNAAGGYKTAGVAGLSGTYDFGGGSSGDVDTMEFSGGILTAVTTVP